MPRMIEIGRCYIGVDPGVSGGMAALSEEGEIMFLSPMPETEFEIFCWFDGVRIPELGNNCSAVIEQVGAMPGQGVTSMFTFGQNFGALKMALTACEISYVTRRPQDWMKSLGIPPKKEKKERKIALRQYTQRLFPKIAVWTQPLKVQNAVCDALLIAHYCRLFHQGKL